jgi:RNA polymerase sigma factor (sigma-70 family)
VSSAHHEPDPVDPAIGELYRELFPRLLRYAEGILGAGSDAEEAVQDAFLAAARAGPLDEPRGWLFRVTRNASIDQLRRRRHLSLLGADGFEQLQSSARGPHEQAEMAADLRTLRLGLDRLPEQQRSALVLRELSGLGYREIANVVDVSEANVKVLIFRARQSLQAFGQAARLPCEAAQLALSAHADGEAGRTEAARARLHAVSCAHCREFAGAVRGQRTNLGMLVPLAPMGHSVASAAAHAVVGAKAGGGVGGLFGLKSLAATAAAVVVVSTGAVVAEHEGVGSQHGGHGRPAPPATEGRRAPFVAPRHHAADVASTTADETRGGGETSSGDDGASGDGASGDSGTTTDDGGSTSFETAGSGDGATTSGDGASSSEPPDVTTTTSGDRQGSDGEGG